MMMMMSCLPIVVGDKKWSCWCWSNLWKSLRRRLEELGSWLDCHWSLKLKCCCWKCRTRRIETELELSRGRSEFQRSRCILRCWLCWRWIGRWEKCEGARWEVDTIPFCPNIPMRIGCSSASAEIAWMLLLLIWIWMFLSLAWYIAVVGESAEVRSSKGMFFM